MYHLDAWLIQDFDKHYRWRRSDISLSTHFGHTLTWICIIRIKIIITVKKGIILVLLAAYKYFASKTPITTDQRLIGHSKLLGLNIVQILLVFNCRFTNYLFQCSVVFVYLFTQIIGMPQILLKGQLQMRFSHKIPHLPNANFWRLLQSFKVLLIRS